MSENKSEWIVDTTEDSFERDVFQRSHEVPVVVDFWAAWCQPCRMLAPALEQLAGEFGGKFVLVKADTDQVSKAAQEFQVSGIPAVFGVAGGEVVDFFQGVLPPAQLREWIERLLVRAVAEQARTLELSDPQAAEAKYREVLEQLPHDLLVKTGLARALAAQDRSDEARAIIDEMEEAGFLEPEAEKLKAQLELARMQGGDVDQCRAAVTETPGDFGLQLKLAEALVGTEQYEEALQIAVELVQKDRHGTGEPARRLMLDVFRVLPDDSELTTTYRRKLSTALY